MGVPMSPCIAPYVACHDAIASYVVAPASSADVIACCVKYAAMTASCADLRLPYDLPLLCLEPTLSPRVVSEFPWLPSSPVVVKVPPMLREVTVVP